MALRLFVLAVTVTTRCKSDRVRGKESACDVAEPTALLQHPRPTQIVEPRPASLQEIEKAKLKLDGAKAVVDVDLSSIPAFVLNLDRRTDRLANFSQTLYEQAPWLQKITCRVAAPDGKAFGDHLKESLIPRPFWQSAAFRDQNEIHTFGGTLTKGGVALTIGHAIMWEHLLQTQVPWGIFMEDDLMYVHPDLGSLLQKLGNSLPAPGHDWDFLQIQGGECPSSSLSTPLHIVNRAGYNTGMYILTREGAQNAIEAVFPMMSGQLDNPEGFLRSRCRPHQVCPVPAMQRGPLKDTDVQIISKPVKLLEEPLIPDCPLLEVGQMLKPDLISPEESGTA
ncbi:colgalt1 [Symbiodinium pilosum]|uniref:Colgalt1 protein n=1 Tax=Symbiodinium pilosum TaxID=2952 RepID=A0A812T8I4_SYMPI|nr:colgalt1 [Symbiodinium pilosum]